MKNWNFLGFFFFFMHDIVVWLGGHAWCHCVPVVMPWLRVVLCVLSSAWCCSETALCHCVCLPNPRRQHHGKMRTARLKPSRTYTQSRQYNEKINYNFNNSNFRDVLFIVIHPECGLSVSKLSVLLLQMPCWPHRWTAWWSLERWKVCLFYELTSTCPMSSSLIGKLWF